MEFNRIQSKMKELHSKPSVRSLEAVAISPVLYLGSIGYFAGSVVINAVKPTVDKLKSKVEEIDNNQLNKVNRRQRRVFVPDPGAVEDITTAPSVIIDDFMLTASETGIPLEHKQQEGNY